MSKNIQRLDLKNVVNRLIEVHSSITELYLFGSRAYVTNSLRSDIDILAVSSEELNKGEINDWLPIEFPMVDLFITDTELTRADSASNGSVIKRKPEKANSLIAQLDAITLWTKKDGFNNKYTGWEQRILKDIDFKMSVIPDHSEDSGTVIKRQLAILESDGIKTFYAGSTFAEIGETILEFRNLKRAIKQNYEVAIVPVIMIITAIANGIGENIFSERFLWATVGFAAIVIFNYYRRETEVNNS